MKEKFNIVLVLGAGASYEAGAPLMNGFFDKSRFLYSRGNLGNDVAGDFQRVFHAINVLQSSHSKAFLDIYNLESVFTSFEFAQLLDINHEFNQELIISLKKLIAVTIEKSLKFELTNNADDLEAPRSYLKLANLLKEWQELGCQITIISFNYDIALDYALLKARLQINYCLNDEYPPHDQEIVLLKLHGSLHWRKCNECNRVFYINLFDPIQHPSNIFPNTAFVEVGLKKVELKHLSLDNKNYCSSKLDDFCYLVPPSWNKYGYYMPISPIWRQAAKKMQKAKSIFICGYSLPTTDQFFQSLYSLGAMGGDPLHSFDVYNPDSSEEIQSRFKSLLGTGSMKRFRYTSGEEGRFSESIQAINDTLKNLLKK